MRPVGSATDINVDVRIIAATNENIEQAIEEGRFRQDLYHRINEFSLTVPPLRERMEDLEEFVYFFIDQANQELLKEVKGISDEALTEMKKQTWNGNLRELRNVIRRCVLFAEGDTIELDDLPVFVHTIKNIEKMTMTGLCVPITKSSRLKPPCKRREATRLWRPNCFKSTARPYIIRCTYTALSCR